VKAILVGSQNGDVASVWPANLLQVNAFLFLGEFGVAAHLL
jgi:hypothetical protein